MVKVCWHEWFGRKNGLGARTVGVEQFDHVVYCGSELGQSQEQETHVKIRLLRFLICTICLILLVLPVSGCFLLFGSDTSFSEFGCDNPLDPGNTPSTNLPSTKIPASAPNSGELSLYDNGPVTLDPALSAEMSSHTYIMQIYSGLVTLDAQLRPAPDIAERWQKSSDGKVFTFYLRKDVKFQDGRALTAQDVKYSWERACLPATRSTTAGTYLVDIIGAPDMLSGKATTLSGVKVVNDLTLEVSIDAPKAYFLSKLTYSTAMVVDRNNVAAGAEWWRKPNGTGPFKLANWTPDQILVLERNERFYGKMPELKKVTFKLFGGIPMAMYETGEIDVTPVYRSEIDKARDPQGPYLKQLQVSSELSFSYIGFNCSVAPFDDADVRRAFSMAINRQRIIAATMSDMVTPAKGILPPGIPGYSDKLNGLPYDPAAAKKLLNASRYAGKMPPVIVDVSGWGNAIPDWLGAAIQDWRVNLDVEVKVRQLEPEDYMYSIRQEKDQMFINGWIADYPDPQNFLDLLFHSGVENNNGEYSNREIDALLDKAAVEPDENLRYDLYRKIEQSLVEQAATLPMWHNTNYNLVKPYVKGFSVNAVGIPLLSQVTVTR
jgi:oligopeptide transport system substrate-binding protein